MKHHHQKKNWLPFVAAILTALAGIVNICSAATLSLTDRLQTELKWVPADAIVIAHALAVPTGVALLLTSWHLFRRRQYAVNTVIFLLIALGFLNLLKGLDFEETVVSWLIAGLLLWRRKSFTVQHNRETLGPAILRATLVILLAIGAIILLIGLAAPMAHPRPTFPSFVAEIERILTLSGGPLPLELSKPFSWLPILCAIIFCSALILAATIIFRPLRGAGNNRPAAAKKHAAQLVREHGSDTLSCFKLRGDLEHLCSKDGRAVVGYKVEAGVLLISGDPVGEDDAIPGMLNEVREFARERGLTVAALGASNHFTQLAVKNHMRRCYVGDEAIVDTKSFTLRGRRMSSVRKATNRIGTAGYSITFRRVDSLDQAARESLDAISERWREGQAENGFAMSMGELSTETVPEAIVAMAVDDTGTPRGFLHFVPSFGRSAMSLSLMRRDFNTPNGLIDTLIVRSIEYFRDNGIDEVSLNFAAFARWLYAPEGIKEKAAGKIVNVLDPHFQMGSLYRFNAKFFPSWQPRFVVYEKVTALPKVALASLWAEGQIPKPEFPRIASLYEQIVVPNNQLEQTESPAVIR